VDASEKDKLLELVKLAGGRFIERHSYNQGKVALTHVTVEPFTFKCVYGQDAPTKEEVKQEQRKPGRPRKQEGKI
jgi:hypothetical protein